MSGVPDIVLIDRLIADLTTLRRAVAGSCETDEPDAVSEDAIEPMIDTTSAAARFGIPKDTARWLAREKGLGQRTGGRWMVNVNLVRQYLAKRE